jgi:hypothetical protein
VFDVGFHGGYSLSKIAKTAMNKIGDPKLVLELAIVGALRGNNPKDGDEIKLCNGSSLSNFLDMMHRNGVFHRGREGASTQGAGEKLTLARLSAAFAEPVARALKKIDAEKPIGKRFRMNKLPAYYEFAGFGTLRLSKKMRDEHLIFSHEFSKAIGKGNLLDEEIYNKMANDAVLIRSLEVSDNELLKFTRPTEDTHDLCKMIDNAS